MIIYDSANIYIDAQPDLLSKINALNAVIDALEATALKAAGNGDVDEYELDNGQTKIRTRYRNPSEVARSITAFEIIRQRYINRYNKTGMVRLSDQNNFRRNYGFNGTY